MQRCLSAPNYTPGLGEVFWLRRSQRYGACHPTSYLTLSKGTTRIHLHLKPCSHSCYLDTTYFCWLIPAHNSGPLQPRMQSKWPPRYPSNDRRETQGGASTAPRREETPLAPQTGCPPLQPTFSICPFPIHFLQICLRWHPSPCENRSR